MKIRKVEPHSNSPLHHMSSALCKERVGFVICGAVLVVLATIVGCMINPDTTDTIQTYALSEEELLEDGEGREDGATDGLANGGENRIENGSEDGEKAYVMADNTSTPMTRAASPNASVAMTITNEAGNVVGDNGSVSTDVTTGVVNYITSNIAVVVRDIKSFYVTVQAAEGATSELVGTEHKGRIATVSGSVKPSSFGDNSWGSALTSVASGTSGNVDITSLTYSALPAYNTTPIQQSSATNLSDGTYNLKLVFAAKINADKPADSYGTTAMISVVATPKELINYSITYNGNGSTSGAVAAQTASSTAESYTFTVAGQGDLVKDGYEFLGWANSASATTPDYTAGVSQITLTKDVPSKTVYGVWKQSITPTTPLTNWNDLQYMQQMTPEACASAQINDSKQLVDSRDNAIYWITKLKDNKCWMTQNLDLSLTTSSKLSSTDTDLPENVTTYTPTDLNDYKTYHELGYYVYSSAKASTYLPGLGCERTFPEKCTDYYEAYNMNNIVNDTKAHYLVGNVYPWPVAKAGQAFVEAGSICPRSWTLPSKSDYSNLIVGLDQNSIRIAPYYFIPLSNGWQSNGNHGYYWSSTPDSSDYANAMWFYNKELSVSRYYRSNGYPIRCIVNQDS